MTNKIPDSNKYSFLELISSFEKIIKKIRP